MKITTLAGCSYTLLVTRDSWERLAVPFTGFICDVRPAYSAVPMSKSKASRFGYVGAKATTTTATLFVPQIQIKFTKIGSDKIKIN